MKTGLLFLVFLLVACEKQALKSLEKGVWGAEGAELRIEENSWYIELGCAHVLVSEPVMLVNSSFESQADYFLESGVFIDDPEYYKARPGKISGNLKENGDLEVIIFGGENLDVVGTYTFRYNRQAQVFKCA